MSSSSMPRCPACRAAAEPRTRNDAFPFCSRACKLADLGRWLDGAYRVPGDPVDVTDFVGRPSEDDQAT